MKRATDLDVIIGSRIRTARATRAYSRTRLSEALGLSEQQLWKYEKGENRVPASRLWEISQLLEFPMSWFLTESEEQVEEAKAIAEMSAKALEYGYLMAKMARKQRMMAYIMIEALILHSESEAEPEAELTEEEGEAVDG